MKVMTEAEIKTLRKFAQRAQKFSWYESFCDAFDSDQKKIHTFFKTNEKALKQLEPYIRYYKGKTGSCVRLPEAWILRNPNAKNTCAICNKPTPIHFYGGYVSTCSMKCAALHCVPNREATCLKKYGVSNPSSSKKVQKKRLDTFRNVFGCDNPFQNEMVKAKIRKSNLIKYGVENPSQSKEIQKRIQTYSFIKWGETHWTKNKEAYKKTGNAWTPKMLEKARATYKAKTGYDTPFQNPKVLDKIATTNFRKIGVENPWDSEIVQKKILTDRLARTGYAHNWSDPACREKMKKTNLARYGVEYPSVLPRIRHQHKKIKDRNGVTHTVEGYEAALIEKLSELSSFKTLVTGRKNLCVIKYMNHKKSRSYYPDMYLETTNGKYIIEVKSAYTLGDSKFLKNNLCKFKAAVRELNPQGIVFLLAVGFNKQGQFLIIKNPTTKTALIKAGFKFSKTGCRLPESDS